jgi:hypothetical protein
MTTIHPAVTTAAAAAAATAIHPAALKVSRGESESISTKKIEEKVRRRMRKRRRAAGGEMIGVTRRKLLRPAAVPGSSRDK